MPIYKVQAPDGSIMRIEGPDGASDAQLVAAAQAAFQPTQKAETTLLQDVMQARQNLGAGMVRGAGSIGATLLAPYDIAKDALAGKGLTLESNRERRAGIDGGLRELGAETDSRMYKGGKIVGEVAGTAGAGGLAAQGVARVAPGATALTSAIASGGFRAGAGQGMARDIATRAAGGAINGMVTAGMVNPEDAGVGAIVGGLLPGAVQLSGAAGNALSRKITGGADRLMQSAIKPTIAQLKSGEADTAVKELLARGINPTEAGVNKLRALIDDVDNQIGASIAGSGAQIDKQNVLSRLLNTKSNFSNQVSPTADLKAIQGVADDFMAHPNFSGSSMPVQAAQDLKRGTYKVLEKKFGQMGSAETEAQKALARGLKEEIATAVPGVQGMNEELSKLITTLNVSERRALMEMNKNPMGLAALAQSPASWAMFMADKSALFKSLAARALNSSSGGAAGAGRLLESSAANPALRNAVILPVASD